MKHPTYFTQFLEDQVNIDPTRLDKLAGRVDSVYGALKADENLGPLVLDKIPQGSWPHRTIIRPKAGGEFDADFLLLLAFNPEWDGNPKAYQNAVYNALHNHSTYGLMGHGRRTRCVYVTYSVERDIGCHLDIVPYVYLPDGRQVIVNSKTNEWETTSPTGFSAWIKERDDLTGGNFRKVVRLMKYYKVHRGSFNGVPSVILTTLLGEQVSSYQGLIDSSYYGNVPTTLIRLVTDLNQWLQLRPTIPTAINPGGDGTNFDHRWTQETYTNFRTRMKTCAEQMNEAADETDPEKSMKLWQKVFGDSFTPITPKPNSSNRFGDTTAAGAALSTVASSSGKSG